MWLGGPQLGVPFWRGHVSPSRTKTLLQPQRWCHIPRASEPLRSPHRYVQGGKPKSLYKSCSFIPSCSLKYACSVPECIWETSKSVSAGDTNMPFLEMIRLWLISVQYPSSFYPNAVPSCVHLLRCYTQVLRHGQEAFDAIQVVIFHGHRQVQPWWSTKAVQIMQNCTHIQWSRCAILLLYYFM